MPDPIDPLANLTAQIYNSMTTGLGISRDDFQIAQGDLIAPDTTQLLWTMMNQIPNDSIAQVYDSSTISNLSGEYETVLSNLTVAGSADFKTTLGDQYSIWLADWRAYAHRNLTISSQLPTEQAKFFNEWATMNLDPGTAATAANALSRILTNPVGIAQQLMLNAPPGATIPFTVTHGEMLKQLNHGQTRGFSMDSSTASGDLSGAWSSESGSKGGTYFYTTSESSESSSFTSTFASSNVTVQTNFEKVVTVPFTALATGSLQDGGQTYLPWFYGAALVEAYQDDTSDLWSDPTKWTEFFGSDGSLQYVTTALVIADGISQTTTSDASFSSDQQTYAHSESHAGYGCWPYYVKSDSSSTTSTNVSFDSSGHMTTTVSSATNNPIVIGVLVSSVKSLIQSHAF
ncbi:hypothetical protein [Parerythrobacter lacustris]|uniref:Uncharacterized protein n=1 Tax=Parerythrobacter lacustris TaxID=2969984 RepID=A0ABT1XU57_9SPHN|nr:hypothetical protein [Parerythrobacter lacustris]MCR2835226.1 hypothetical protein [Parerythrobacter lacustris]